jgi:hypothetical protein
VYASPVVHAFGLGAFAGTLDALREQTADMRLKVVKIQSVVRGSLVTAEALPTVGPKVVHTFFLRLQQSHWRLLYDTMTAAGVQQYAQTQKQRGINPNANDVAPGAVRAGDAAINAYRSAALSLVRGSAR